MTGININKDTIGTSNPIDNKIVGAGVVGGSITGVGVISGGIG